MNVLNIILGILLIVCWCVAFYALINSDGKCTGICNGCVYSGNCPQEEEKNERK